MSDPLHGCPSWACNTSPERTYDLSKSHFRSAFLRLASPAHLVCARHVLTSCFHPRLLTSCCAISSSTPPLTSAAPAMLHCSTALYFYRYSCLLATSRLPQIARRACPYFLSPRPRAHQCSLIAARGASARPPCSPWVFPHIPGSREHPLSDLRVIHASINISFDGLIAISTIYSSSAFACSVHTPH